MTESHFPQPVTKFTEFSTISSLTSVSLVTEILQQTLLQK